MTQEALKLALEAFEQIFESTPPYRDDGTCVINDKSVELSNKAITAIKEALAQEQEPVATITSESGNPDVKMSWWHEPALPVGTNLYTTPPQRTWVGLTDEQIDACWNKDLWKEKQPHRIFAKAIELKLKELNT